MFSPQGPSVRELAKQALSSVEGGYDLLAQARRAHPDATCPLPRGPRSAVRDDLTASGFTVTTLPLTALGRREDGSPRYGLVLARRASTP